MLKHLFKTDLSKDKPLKKPNSLNANNPNSNNPNSNQKWLFWLSVLLFSLASIYGFGRSGLEAVSYALILQLTLYVIRRFSNKLFLGYIILTFCLSFLYLPHALNYGQLSVGSLASVFETNFSEAFEYLINTPVFSYIASIGYLLLFLAVLKLNKNQPKKLPVLHKKSHKYLFYFGCLLVLVSIVQKPLYNYQKYDKEKRQELGWKVASTTKSYPLKFICDSFWLNQDYFKQKAKLDHAKQQVPTWEIVNSSQKYKNYVIIIGESMRKDYMSLYGYPIITTPFLQSTPAVIFDDFIAPASHTATSLQRQLFQQKDYQNINYANTVISLANMGGMDTYWLSNQGTMGEYDTMASSIAIKADEKYFTKVGDYDSSNVSDLALLKELDKIVNSNEHIDNNVSNSVSNIISNNNTSPVHNSDVHKSRLIIMHIMGSHPKFCNRLDKEYQIDNVTGFLNSDMSCYLSSIRQTDKLLERIYNTLQKTSKQVPSLEVDLHNEKRNKEETASGFSMMYLSDHGLSHRNRSNQSYRPTTLLHGDDTKQNYQVPLIILSSDDEELVRIADKKSGFDLMIGLAEWLGIKEKILSQEDRFFDGNTQNFEEKNILNNLPNNTQKEESIDVDKATPTKDIPIKDMPRKVFANGNIVNYADLIDDPAMLP